MQRESVSIIAEFMIVYGEGLYSPANYRELYQALSKHIEYNTLEVLRDEKGIKAVCRYNHTTDNIIFVIDVICRKGSKTALRELIKNGVKRNPDIKYITYDRGLKYPDKKRQTIKVSDFLRRR